MHHRLRWNMPALAILAAASLSTARPADPILIEDQLIYPEGAAIPRSLTPVEAGYILDHPLSANTRGSTPPDYQADVRCPGEYEPMQGIILAWEPFGSVQSILSAMVREITTTGAADAYIMVDNAAEQTSVTSTVSAAGANMSRVYTFIVATDTIWIRDYGPRYIFEGNVRSIVDHTYNRPRPNDDAQPAFWATTRHAPRYDLPLVHGGGNYHLSSLGNSWATRLIKNENNALSEAQIIAFWNQFQNVTTTITDPFPTGVDSTQHIDMWMQILGDRKVMISDWPLNAGSTQDNICDTVAGQMAAAGWTVTRCPAYSAGAHYTYCNVVMCNNLVLLPTYTNGTVTANNGNGQALAAWTTALAGTGKSIVQVPCQAIVTSAGVMHCIAMHVPAPVGGVSPCAYLRTLRGPETLTPGANVEIKWSTDDDVSVSNVDILLSIDGGASFPTVIASATPDDGLFTWNVPSVYATQARIRIVARDGGANTGFDSSRDDLFINAPPPACDGDADGNNFVDFGDISSVLSNWGGAGPPHIPGDASGNGVVDFGDISSVLERWGEICP